MSLMSDLIRAWISRVPRLTVLKNYKVEIEGITHERYDIMKEDFRVFSYSYVYTDSEIWAVKGNPDLLQLETSEAFSSKDSSYDLAEILKKGLTVYESNTDWAQNKPKDLNARDLKAYLKLKKRALAKKVDKFSFDVFSVVQWEENDDSVIVFFTKEGSLQLPLKFSLTDVSLISKRDYGDKTETFELFVESIGDILRGVLWKP